MKIESKNFKTGMRAILIISFLNIASPLLMSMGNRTNTQQEKANTLFDTWYLHTYVVNGENYPPDKKENDDYLLFKEDLTFISKSEGIEEKGTFLLNTNGAYVLMTSEKGEKIKAYIISISEKSLILKYDIDELRDIEVHYNKNSSKS